MPRPTPEGFIIAIMKISPHKAIDVPSAEMGMKVYSALQDLAYQVSVPQRVILIYDYQNVSPVLLQMWFSSLKYGREILVSLIEIVSALSTASIFGSYY